MGTCKSAFQGQSFFDIYHFIVVTSASNFKSSFFSMLNIFFSSEEKSYPQKT